MIFPAPAKPLLKEDPSVISLNHPGDGACHFTNMLALCLIRIFDNVSPKLQFLVTLAVIILYCNHFHILWTMVCAFICTSSNQC
ncbi:hypothetical protein GIB67_022865 [Kingdonia uniflora]|uniref:Uncharacterized protein n=1 Tax=Kingdonia uniflora TaxID=39325 RepID=A0A7J7P7R4_9MAGN|nr:hypothetical protein GIB67_022865 [Kingdonia uniflora]